jgi:hypothetical protein
LECGLDHAAGRLRPSNARSAPLKRLIPIPLLVVAVAASACGGATSTGAGGSDRTPAQILRDGAKAARTATSTGIDLTATLNMEGATGSAASAFASGPVKLHLEGHAGRLASSKATGKFDLAFDVKASGLTMSGRALSADGKRVYVQVPFALGPGWYYVNLPKSSTKAMPPAAKAYAGVLRNLQVSRWLSGVEVTHPDGTDRIDADLNVRRAVLDIAHTFSAIEKGNGIHMTKRDLQMLDKIDDAVEAHGYVAYDPKTDLPTEMGGDVSVDIAKVDRSSDAPRSIDVGLHVAFSDWNQPFEVTAPQGAKPLPRDRLFGGASPLSAA